MADDMVALQNCYCMSIMFVAVFSYYIQQLPDVWRPNSFIDMVASHRIIACPVLTPGLVYMPGLKLG